MRLSKIQHNRNKWFWLKYFQYVVYYCSFLVWPLLAVSLVMMVWDSRGWWWWVVVLLCLLFIYARFVENGKIRVRRERLVLGNSGESLILVFASDLHLGVFKGERFLRRVLREIGGLGRVDLFLLGGDLINDPTERQLARMFGPLKGFHKKTLAITGNHDAGVPYGDFSSQEVREALERVGVRAVDNVIVEENLAGAPVKVVGLSDLWEGKADWGLLEGLKSDTVNIVLAHNPDAAYEIPAGVSVDLVISGHTHGGQIWLPPLSNWLVPCKYPFVRGWYEVNGRPVFVSSGLGEVVLPMRFLVPPEVVVMEIEV